MNLAGTRYVFFNSLSPSSPMYSIGKSVISSIGSKLLANNNKDNSIDIHINNMKKYLNFIQEMAQTAYFHELQFLNSSIEELEPDDPIRKNFNTFMNGEFNYLQFTKLLNDILQSSQEDNKILQQQIENATVMKKLINKFNSAEQKTMAQFYNGDKMRQYRGMLFSKADNFYDEYKTSYSNILSRKINHILNQLASSSGFKQELIQIYNNSKNADISDEEFKRAVVNFVTQQVLNSPIETDENIISNNTINQLKNNFREVIKKSELNLIDAAESVGKSLEEIALTGSESIGNYVAKLDASSIERIKKTYGDNSNLNQLLDDLMKIVKNGIEKNQTQFNSIRNKVSQLLKQKIQERVKSILGITETKIFSKSNFIQIARQNPNLITPTNLKNGILHSIKGINFTHDALAEAMVQNDVINKIKNVIISDIPGKTITFKADIRFSTGYISENSINFIDNNNIKSIVNDTLEQCYKDFFLIYQDKSKGQTDIKLAMQSYQEWINEMQSHIDQLIDSNEQIQDKLKAKQEAYKALENTFSTSVSVKDYDLYNNILGLHGGSLGSKTAPQKVMENIYEMYSLGGITGLDVDALMTAVINCGDAMMGSGLRTPLENYLLGGAALIMFDDSFALSDTFLSNMTSQLKGQKVVNLYRLQTRYIPGSLILNQIYNNLQQIYADIINNTQQMQNPSSGNRVTITNNVTDSILQDSAIKNLTPENQWEAVRNITENSVLIQFSFMGGLLDILESLPNAFNIN